MYDVAIAETVEAKLLELDGLTVGMATGRRLEFNGAKPGSQYTPAEIRALMGRSMADIGRRVGLHFLQMTPAVALEQFIIVSVIKDQDTAGLIKSLINSFLVTYCTPETTDRAYVHLEGLEGLRREVAARRNRRSNPPGSPVKH